MQFGLKRASVSRAWHGVADLGPGCNHRGTRSRHVQLTWPEPCMPGLILQTQGRWVPRFFASHMRNQAQRDPWCATVSSELMEGPALPTPFLVRGRRCPSANPTSRTPRSPGFPVVRFVRTPRVSGELRQHPSPGRLWVPLPEQVICMSSPR